MRSTVRQRLYAMLVHLENVQNVRLHWIYFSFLFQTNHTRSVMASYFSPDLFLENIYLVVIYLSDGHITVVQDYDSKGRIHESGDLINLCREIGSEGYEERTEPEAAIILGWGGKLFVLLCCLAQIT